MFVKRLVRSLLFLTSFIIVLLIPISDFYIKNGLIYLSLSLFLINSVPLHKLLINTSVKNAIFKYLIGILFGIIMMCLFVLILLLFNKIEISYNSNAQIIIIILISLFWIVQSFFEEYLVRGILYNFCASLFGSDLSIIITSLIFALFHIGNTNISLLAIFNIFMFGILCGYLIKIYKNLYIVSGIHFIWNYLQGNFFGFEVSGNELNHSLFHCFQTPQGELLHGGKFGVEGGLIASLVLCCSATLFILLSFKKKKVNESYYLYISIDGKFLFSKNDIKYLKIDNEEYQISSLLSSSILRDPNFISIEGILEKDLDICINIANAYLDYYNKSELLNKFEDYQSNIYFVKGKYIIRSSLNYALNK